MKRWPGLVRSVPSFVYFIECSGTRAIKIGIAVDVEKRLATLQTGNPSPMSVIAVVPGARANELRLHMRFRPERLRGEWFRGDGDLRQFVDRIRALTDADRVAAINEPTPARADECSVDEMRDFGDRLTDACKQAVRDLGVGHCSAALTRAWGPKGRPVSEYVMQGVIDGRFSMRVEWLWWFARQSDGVADVVEEIADDANRCRDDDVGEIARARIALREELGERATAILRRARTR